MSLVNELIAEVVNSSSDLSQALRKARVLASELRSDELQAWAEAELNGYKDKDALPDYRVSPASNYGDFAGRFGAVGKGLPIFLSSLPEDWREDLSKLELREGVAALQEMLQSEKDYKGMWPADEIAAVSQDIYNNMRMVNAWMTIPKARIAATLDAVRNRLLNFLLDLKKQHPEVEATNVNFQSIPKDDVRVSVVNNIYGGSNVLASGGTVHQQVQQGVKPSDLGSLLSFLRGAALPEELLTELSDAVKEDAPVRKGGIGPRVFRWLTKVSENVATSTVVALATQALLQYYNHKPAQP